MTIGKRKGYTAKGTGAEPGQDATKKVGGSLSKNDHWYLQQAFGTSFDPGAASLPGIEATGGDIKDYQSPDTIDPASGQGQWYRSHTFRTSGAFTVTELGVRGGNIDYVIVAGGGGGGNCWGPGHNAAGGGAGAGGLLSATNVNMSNGTYPVAIGGGGAGAKGTNTTAPGWGGANGSDSTFALPTSVSVVGGGGGGTSQPSGAPGPTSRHDGGGGGSGGGAATRGSSTGTLGTGYDFGNPGQQGYPGGTSGSNFYAGGGGGGAGGVGISTANTPGGPDSIQAAGGHGGIGKSFSYRTGDYEYYAGGGAGGSWINNGYYTTNTIPLGGEGGGGMGGYHGNPNTTLPTRYNPTAVSTVRTGESGQINSGGGGGGAAGIDVSADAGAGGSGIMVVRYEIDGSQEGKVAKATGGDIAFTPAKTVHVFRSSGTFTVRADQSPQAIDYVIVAGGGASKNIGGGGGGGV